MRKHYKKYFVPHKHNQYHPHLFRNTSIIIIVAISIFLLGISYGNSIFLKKTVLGVNIATNVLVDMANQNRMQNNVAPLTRNAKLDSAAKMKADDMVSSGYFAHYAPDGTTPWYFIREAGYNFLYAGENLAINYTSEKEIDDAWMNSQYHKENLLNTNFRELGIGTREGVYQGVDTVYVVQMFGARAEAKKVEPKIDVEENAVPVQGVGAKLKQESKTKRDDVKVIKEGKGFIAVKSNTVKEESKLALADEKKASIVSDVSPVQANVFNSVDSGTVAGAETYSTSYDRFLFNMPFYVEILLVIFVAIISFGLLLRIFIEYRRQHIRHVVTSVLFLALIVSLAVYNLRFVNLF
jgi:Cysteine-rich secretory protein family